MSDKVTSKPDTSQTVALSTPEGWVHLECLEPHDLRYLHVSDRCRPQVRLTDDILSYRCAYCGLPFTIAFAT